MTPKPASPTRRRRTADNLRRAIGVHNALREFARWTNRSPSASRAIDVAEDQVENAARRYLRAHGGSVS